MYQKRSGIVKMISLLLILGMIIPSATFANSVNESNIRWSDHSFTSVRNGFIIYSENGKYGFMDTNFNKIIDAKYDYMSFFDENGFAPVGIDNKYGIVDKTGKEVVPPIYDTSTYFTNGTAPVSLNWDYSLVDTKGNILTEKIYSLIVAETDGLRRVTIGKYPDPTSYAFIDASGKEVLSNLEYDNVDLFFSERASVSLNQKYGFIDKTGKEVVPLKYDRVNNFDEDLGLAVVQLDGKYGVIDKSGKEIISPQYEDIYLMPNDGSIIFRLNDYEGLMNKSGKIVIPAKYETTTPFSDGLSQVSLNGKYGFVDETGKEVIPLKYSSATNFSEGLAPVEIDGKIGYIDKTGKLAIPAQFDIPEGFFYFDNGFKDGIAAVSIKGKFGFIDKTGKIIIPAIYDTIDRNGKFLIVGTLNDPSDNFYATKGLLDLEGNEILPIKYNNIYFNFDGSLIVQEGLKFGLIKELKLETKKKIPIEKDEENLVKALATSSTVLVNGVNTSFEAYNINGNNYFKLRDLAKVVSGSEKQFEVGWDNENKVINLLTNKEYTSVGGELAAGDGLAKEGKLNTSKIFKDGEEVELLAYNINENNYFKLRDIARSFNIGVTWDDASKTIGIDTSIGYSE